MNVRSRSTLITELTELSAKLKSAREAEAELRREMSTMQEKNKAALVEQVKIMQRSKSSTNHRLLELEVSDLLHS